MLLGEGEPLILSGFVEFGDKLVVLETQCEPAHIGLGSSIWGRVYGEQKKTHAGVSLAPRSGVPDSNAFLMVGGQFDPVLLIFWMKLCH